MKTPLRTPWQWKGGEPCLNKHDEPRCTIVDQVTRWKSKNRIRQLKHTIARITAENYALSAKLQATSFACSRAMAQLETPKEP